MKQWFQSLKSQERRWLVFIGFVVFLLLNWFFIWPHFHDWAINDALRIRSLQQTGIYRAELSHKAEYERKLKELQSDGSTVLPEDQAIDFVHFLNSRAVSNHVRITQQGNLSTRTNDFFLEQQMGISVEADETNLVSFLYSLGAGNSMMRVRAMSLHPDQTHMLLNAGITIVASYQKKAPAPRTGGAMVTATNAPAKPVAAPPVKAIAKVVPPVNAPPPHTNRFSNPFSRATSTNSSRPGISTPKRP